ncbi:MAG: DNA repair protein RecO [Bacteroidales bacterium]|nr:DNA repair protein RecO [Bacteroidales bacterium]
MLHKTRAIVLHYIKYGESSLIVTCYTEQFGRITCMVNGARAKKSKTPVTLFQPLGLLEIDMYYKPGKEIQRLKDAWCPQHYTSISFNTTKSTIALFLAEVLFHSLKEEDSNPKLFSFLFHAFQLLDAKTAGVAIFHIWFLLHLTRYLGISVKEHAEVSNLRTLSESHLFANISPGIREVMMDLLNNPQGPPDSVVLTHAGRTELLEEIIRYYASHIDGFSRLKSYAVLREIFK